MIKDICLLCPLISVKSRISDHIRDICQILSMMNFFNLPCILVLSKFVEYFAKYLKFQYG
jgi:hypothetical protein